MFQPMHPSAFFKYFMSNLGAHTELQTKLFILSIGVDCSNSINYSWVQVLSNSKYFLLSTCSLTQSAGAIEYTDCTSAEG